MSCTDTGPFDGGTYNDPVINDPVITGGTATNLTLSNPSLTGSVTLDSTAASTLLTALQEITPTAVTDDPLSSTDEDLPVKIIGEDRTALLGKPAIFIKIGSYMIPAYRAE